MSKAEGPAIGIHVHRRITVIVEGTKPLENSTPLNQIHIFADHLLDRIGITDSFAVFVFQNGQGRPFKNFIGMDSPGSHSVCAGLDHSHRSVF